MADRYTMIFIPETGLFWRANEFQDGEGKRIPWSFCIPSFSSEDAAIAFRDKLDAAIRGHYIIVPFREQRRGEPVLELQPSLVESKP